MLFIGHAIGCGQVRRRSEREHDGIFEGMTGWKILCDIIENNAEKSCGGRNNTEKPQNENEFIKNIAYRGFHVFPYEL